MEDLSECIEFTGRKNNKGYGVVSLRVDGKAKQFFTHRLAYADAHGPIPDGLHVLHRCDNPPCINPDHLLLGTHADNMRDMRSKGRGYIPARKVGSAHSQAKLTEQDIPRIRDMLVCGCSLRAIAAWFGVSHRAISCIKLGKSWRHVL